MLAFNQSETLFRIIMAKELKIEKTETYTHLKVKIHPKVNVIMQEGLS